MFLVMEGGDGAGKSTQIKRLADFLREKGHAVTVCREPGSTKLGEEIRDILLNRATLTIHRMSELLLFMAARAQVTNEVIRPALARGEIVLADRFVLSSVVYQGYAGGLDIEQLREIGRIATGGLEPDGTLILDISVTAAKARRNAPPDRLESEADSFHERVRRGFLSEAARNPEKIHVVSAEQSVETLQQVIRNLTEAILASPQP